MKHPPPRRPSSDATLTRILEAAADEFAESGYAGARMDLIARRAGVNKATLYYQLGDKQALYEEILQRVFSEAADRLEAETASADSPEAKLRSFIRNMTRTVASHRHFAPIMLREVAGGGKTLPDSILREMSRILRLLGAIVSERGEAPPFVSVPPFILHFMITGTALLFKTSEPIRERIGALIGEFESDGPPDPDTIADTIERIILDGIRTHPSFSNQRDTTP